MYMKRFFAFVISAFLIFFPVYSYATTSVGGWTAVDALIAGANTTINATKTAGGKVLTSAITIAPQAGKVGKYLLRGGAVGALALAVPQLIGDGVDWVLDPANNSIKYKNPSYGDVTTYKVRGSTGVYSTKDEAGTAACFTRGGVSSYYNETSIFVYVKCGNGGTLTIDKINTPSGDEYKYIPIDTVAAKVISNAEAGHAPSQEAVKAAALEGFAAGEHDAALESAAVESDAGTENPPDTTNPDNPAPTDPALPVDLSPLLGALNAIKALLAGLLSSVTGFFDWTQEEPPEELEPVPVPYGELGDVGLDGVDRYEQRINFAGQCPANDFSFSMLGVTYSKPIPYEHLCRFLVALAPWLLAMTYLGTAYFVVENT